MTKVTLKSRKQFLKKLPSCFFFFKSRLSGQSTSLLAQQQSTLLSSGTENALFVFFRQEFEKPLFFNALEFFEMQILQQKYKFLGQKCLILIFLENTFKNLLEFVKFQSLILNKKKVKLGSRIIFLRKFRRAFEKTIVILAISTFQFIKRKVSGRTRTL